LTAPGPFRECATRMVPTASARPARPRARRGIGVLLTAYRRRRFAWLFGSLLLTLGAGPTLDALASRYNPLAVLLALNLLAAIGSVAREREMRLPLLLGGGFLVARGLRAALGLPGMLAFSEGLWVTAMALVTAAAVRHALRPGVVSSERILAALDAYLLTGLLFGVAYALLDRAWPGSFGAATPLGPGRAIYFSFVTLATLGYGDVVPVSEPVRGLAIVEAVSGQMYMAVLVARLVSLYSQQRDD
jgi:hypothetical protein